MRYMDNGPIGNIRREVLKTVLARIQTMSIRRAIDKFDKNVSDGDAKLIDHFRGVFNDFGVFGNFGPKIHPTGTADSPGGERQLPPFAEQFMQRQGMPLADAALSFLSDMHYLAVQYDRWLAGSYYGERPTAGQYRGAVDPYTFREDLLNWLFRSSQTDHYYED